MDRDPRDRGAARSDVASLWIEFLLLPEKLEEHLAAGNAAIPTPPDLISMFLEQALLSHKSVQQGNNTSANGLSKESEPQGAVKMTNRTASLLCERAARVAVVVGLTLSDIESSIPAPLHQFVLLKALIRHDKSRSLLHGCNFHRWLIHKALESHPVGSAFPNAVLPVSRLGSWIAGDDPGEVLHGVVNGTGDPPTSVTGDPRNEEERPSVEFLEKILHGDIKNGDSSASHADTNSLKGMANGGSGTEQVLSIAYRCQVILDVAEVHFMRGRIRRAHELFSKCGEMLSSLPVHGRPSLVETGEGFPITSVAERSHTDTPSELSPVPQERLSGFLVACKMLLGTSPDANGVESTRSIKYAGNPEPCHVGIPSPAQLAIISSEQSRWAARKYGSKVTSQSALANGDSGGSDFSSGKDNVEASMSGKTSTDMTGRALEDSGAQHLTRKRTYQEEANGDVMETEGQLEKEEGLSGETFRRIKESENRGTSVDKMQIDEPCSVSKGQSDQLLSNGDEGRTHESKEGEVQEVNWDRQTVETSMNAVPNFGDKQSQMSSDIVNSEQITGFSGCGHQVDLFVDLKSDPADNVFPKLISDTKDSTTTVQEKKLIQAFVEDILRGHLPWGYCLAIEKDLLLSIPVRSKLAACNVVRSVLEGAPLETFLRTRGDFENSEESVEFVMQILLAIKTLHEGNMLSVEPSPYDVDSRQNGRLEKRDFLKQAKDIDVCAVLCRVHDLALFACCVIDKPWCWGFTVKLGLVSKADLPRFSGQLPQNTLKDVEGSGIFLKADAQQESLKTSLVPKLDDAELISEREILLSFVQAESIYEIEALVGNVRKMTRKVRAQKTTVVIEGLQKLGQVSSNSDLSQSPVQSDSVKLTASQSQIASKFWSKHQSTSIGPDRDQCSLLETDVSAILRRRAYNALETMNDSLAARRLYELVLTFQPRDCDSAMMLWLLERCAESDRQVVSQGTRDLPKRVEGDVLPNFSLLDFVILKLIEKESWGPLCEFCKWAASLILTELPMVRDGEQQQGKNPEKEALVSPPGVPVETVVVRHSASWQLRHKRLLQTLNIARTIVDLMPLCGQLQAAVSRNHFNEDVARLGSTLSNLFEEFLCFLVGIESEGHIRGSDDTAQWRNIQAGIGSAGVALISKVSNSKVLTALASLTAGWLQRCHVVGLTPWPLSVERYGVLAGVTAGASLPPPVGPLPYPASVLRPVPPRVSPEFGRDLFGVLLEGIVRLPGVVEGDREKGHRWLQGLADIAFEDEAYVKALRLYLQAGAIRSAQYCDRASSMNRDIFTPWVIQRMKVACRSIGAGLQAAVLCQCLPVPDHESAFRILQENTLIMDRDAEAYFECIWEVPILELLVHLHSRAGDEARVAKLIGLLQQPALNVHNPSAIRQAHISTMEQRFLQRLAGELL